MPSGDGLQSKFMIFWRSEPGSHGSEAEMERVMRKRTSKRELVIDEARLIVED
ncbi:uncharacterized protein FOMMEDRAFT_161456 [Fomitiporia mediterranea MF3/22]|uniref:uncharacterized protein n=1 Tax=Fomitiporia mediterranea (strain MF3/22) TaxID=694068 RepID=UPI0004408CAD|nr:uncharacterized protein FOMMEDRAFT_161456 [Fomitiporia mediterranea MF3/22]EJC98630.1 hypothetical protein FOMMEDRAFT_161456 [Fomitiporia mediterranea MF3/22]